MSSPRTLCATTSVADLRPKGEARRRIAAWRFRDALRGSERRTLWVDRSCWFLYVNAVSSVPAIATTEFPVRVMAS
jgi:hypothetical protein